MTNPPNKANQHGPQTPLRGICVRLFAALCAPQHYTSEVEMSDDKYNRSINLLCPTCGSDQFEYDDDDMSLARIIHE